MMPVPAMAAKESRSPRSPFVLLFVLSVILAAAFLWVKDASYFGDEGFHMSQITLFLDGNFSMDPSIAMLPGFHAVMAGVSVVVGEKSLAFLRFVNLCLSILSVVVFYYAARAIDAASSRIKTIRYAFFPILFPFFFLLYTDLIALLFVVLAAWMAGTRRFSLAALAAGASVLCRQNNIIWFGFFFLVFLWQAFPVHVIAAEHAWKRKAQKIWQTLRHWKKRQWLASGFFLLGFALFGVFAVLNKGIAVGDKTAHPFPDLHLGNVYFLLALSCAFFLPSHLGRLPKIGKKFASSRWLIPVIMGSFLLYMLLYANDHPYNQDLHSVFLRNRILVYFDQTPLLRLAFYFPMAWALACLATVKLRRPEYYLLYPLTVLYLLPSWLIEQRYDLVPFVLFILYTDNHPGEENALAVYGVLFTVLLYVIVATRYLFL